jgi:hypothetical protein
VIGGYRTSGELIGDIGSACRRATSWVLAQQRPSGVIGDPASGFKYYRGPWALASMGELGPALALCDWIRDNLLRDGKLDGDLRILTDGWAYRDSALIVGAQMLGQYDLSHGLVDSLCAWQDPISGGFANDATPAGDGSDEMDIPYAAGPGLALLATGRLDEARRVAGFLKAIYAAQPALPDRFYCFWSRQDQRPIIESDPAFEQRFVVDQHADRMQRWTIGGIAAGFLGRLYLADPQPGYLALAREYQGFSMAATDAQFNYPSVCKSSWGASLLYQITGEDAYLDWLQRMAQWYLETQEADGWWHPWVERTTADVIEITLEFIMHLRVLAGALAPGLRKR